jgi:hypothetical protein
MGRRFRPAAGAPARLAAPLLALWRPFVESPDPPLVVYSNAEFIGRPETGLRYLDPAADRDKPILDHYTGVGEVMAVHELDRLFLELDHPLRIKRSRLLTWDDAKATNLIFVGSPSENLPLRDMPGSQEFAFRRVSEGPRKGDLALMNLHPRPGDALEYLNSPGTPVTDDYALISSEAGLGAGRRAMVLAGITTLGTQAAVEFVCRANRVGELLSRLGVTNGADTPAFEAVLKVRISGGVPVESEIITVHVRK